MGIPFSHLSTAEQIARVRLIRSENVGPVSFRHLLARFGSAVKALEAVPELARRGGGRAIRLAAASTAAAEIEATRAAGGEVLFLGVPPYPTLLSHIEDAPPVLAVMGHIVLADRPSVAVVGARNASLAGQNIAQRLGRELAEAGLVVVSGLARGIDTAVHKGALGGAQAGALQAEGAPGGTVGVIAGGLNVFYPPENERLQQHIAEQGLLVTEQPWGAVPQASHFPRRNRIISGLSLGLVVVEATEKSGSLISARLAGEQGRLVMAMPGSPLEPRAHGANGLIRDGATLVQSVADVLEALEPLMRRGVAAPAPPYTPPPHTPPPLAQQDADDSARRAVLTLLGPVPVCIDEVIRATGLPAAIVAIVLLEMELAGRVIRHVGHRVSLAWEA